MVNAGSLRSSKPGSSEEAEVILVNTVEARVELRFGQAV
jgi:hypothetical protein